jgi:effector-binding domain-containing protein
VTTAQENSLNLILEPNPVQFPAIHYLFIEKHGNIPTNAGLAWTELHKSRPAIEEQNQITGYLSLYKMQEGIYRAGVALASAPNQIPTGFECQEFAGGKYLRFVLTGPYHQLGPATSEAVRIVRETGMQLRNDFNIEHYFTDPRYTPEDQLITHILFPLE